MRDFPLIPSHPRGHTHKKRGEALIGGEFLLDLKYFIVSRVYVSAGHEAGGREAEPGG